MRKKAWLRRLVLFGAAAVVCLCLAYHKFGYIAHEREGLACCETEGAEERVNILIRYRPVAALFGKMRGELWITHEGQEYLCEIRNETIRSLNETGKYNLRSEFGAVTAQYWYVDKDGEFYWNHVLMQVVFDRLFQMDQVAVELENGWTIYSLSSNEGFKTLAKSYSPFSRTEDAS